MIMMIMMTMMVMMMVVMMIIDGDGDDIQTKQWAIAKGDPIKKIATVAGSLESFRQRNI